MTMQTKSLRLLLAAVGSRGDIQPMIAVAQAAQARGHRPLLAAPVNFEGWVRDCGIDYAPYGVDAQAYLANNSSFLTGNRLKSLMAVRRALSEFIPAQVRQLQAACAGADAMLWAGVALEAPSVAQWARLPCIGVLYSTCIVPSSLHPPPVFHRYGLPRFANRLLWAVNHLLADLTVGRLLARQRAVLGLPHRSLTKLMFEDGRYVIAADPVIFPSDPRWDPGQFARAQFIRFEDPRPLDPELDAWLREGDAPVFAGFGSMSGPGPRRAAAALVEALSATGTRCIVGSGWARLAPGDIPAGWRVVGDVPHAQLFPRMSVVIHHGGAGTTASALHAGAPQVVLPLILDQYHHAHMLHRAGLAPRPVAMERVTGAALASCIADARAIAPAARQAAALRLHGSNGCDAIVDAIEARFATEGERSVAV